MGFKPRTGFAFTIVAAADNPREDKSALTRLAYDGDLAEVKRVIARGDDVQGNDNQRWFGEASGCISGAPYYTPLGEASRAGHPTIVTALLEAGAAIDALQYTSKSALVLAAERGWADVLEVLLAAGASTAPGTDGHNALVAACGQVATDRNADYPRSITVLLERAGAELVGGDGATRVAEAFEWLPKLLKSTHKDDRDRGAAQMAQLEAAYLAWPGDRARLDAVFRKCERATSSQKKSAAQGDAALRAHLTPAALASPGWGKAISALVGKDIDEGRVPDLTRLCDVVLGDKSAVAHEAWPGLVRQLMDLTIDFAAYTEEVFGTAISPNDDESGTMEGISDAHMYSVDLVLNVLASDAALASPHFGALFHYVCEQKQAKLGHWSLGESELEALTAKPAFAGRSDHSDLRGAAKQAWPFAR